MSLRGFLFLNNYRLCCFSIDFYRIFVPNLCRALIGDEVGLIVPYCVLNILN